MIDSRRELHEFFSIFFPNSKHFLFEIFEDVSDEEIVKKAEALKGYKIPIKLTQLRERIERTGLDDTTYYNAFLEVVMERYKTLREVGKEVERWKKEKSLQFV